MGENTGEGYAGDWGVKAGAKVGALFCESAVAEKPSPLTFLRVASRRQPPAASAAHLVILLHSRRFTRGIGAGAVVLEVGVARWVSFAHSPPCAPPR